MCKPANIVKAQQPPVDAFLSDALKWSTYITSSETYVKITDMMAVLDKTLMLFLSHFGWVGWFWLDKSWGYLAFFVVWYSWMQVGITVGLHRYFAHRCFRTSRLFNFILAVWAHLCCQGGMLWWVCRHRKHHRECDLPGDRHSPLQYGLWYAHAGWILDEDFKINAKLIPDWMNFPELVILEQWTFFPKYIVQVGLFYLIDPMLMWWVMTFGLFCSMNATFMINSIAHTVGTTPHPSQFNPEHCDARNNWLFAVVSFGEGWHNNHHANMQRAHQGVEWWQLDISFRVIQLWEKLGLVWDVVVDYSDSDANIALAKEKAAAQQQAIAAAPQENALKTE